METTPSAVYEKHITLFNPHLRKGMVVYTQNTRKKSPHEVGKKGWLNANPFWFTY